MGREGGGMAMLWVKGVLDGGKVGERITRETGVWACKVSHI